MRLPYRLLPLFYVLLLILISTPVIAQLTAPVPAADILSTLNTHDSLNMFARELRSTVLANNLRQPGPFTVFALDNKALSALPDNDLQLLLGSRAAMQSLLGNYIVKGNLSREQVDTWNNANTLQGRRVHSEQRNDGTFVNGARIVEEIPCTNGTIYVLHTIDRALVEQAIALAKGSVK